VRWPGGSVYANLETTSKTPGDWYGSLVINQTDATGLLFRRNRYYNPQTGQFTQTDPIGIAGGINLYGYANGDPINLSDPFGLCPPIDKCLRDGLDIAVGFVPGVSTGVDLTTALSGTNPITGDVFGVGGRLVVAAGVLLPVSGSQLVKGGATVRRVALAIRDRIGRNRVSIRTPSGFKNVDLAGRTHRGVPTPHTQQVTLHTGPNGRVNTSKGPVRPAKMQDLREVETVLQGRGPKLR